MQIVDAYTHCGLSKYEPIERVREVMQSARVDRAVLVQHLGEFDNAYIGRIVAGDADHFAGVCLVDHEAVDCVDVLEKWATSGSFRGVRLTTDACRGAPHLLRAAAELGLIIVLFAPDGIGDSVRWLCDFLDTYAAARVVVTHLGNPAPYNATGFQAHRDMFKIAQYPNTYLQVSGMAAFSPYPHKILYPLIAEAYEHFGGARLCWGSNYPVVGGHQQYMRDLRMLLDGHLPVPDDAISAIAGDNARRLWFESS